MKALEVYQQDILDQEAGHAQPRQQYYISLRDAFHRELMEKGYSELLEKLLQEIRGGDMEHLYAVDYAALMECHSMIVLGHAMRDVTEYVPHLQFKGKRPAWADLDDPGAGNTFIPVNRDIREKLHQLRAVSRQLVDARDDTVLPQADNAAQREIDQVHALNKMLDERCKALEEEREALQARVQFLSEGLITEQVRQAITVRKQEEEEAIRKTYEAQKLAAEGAFRSLFAKEQQDDRARVEAEERLLGDVRQAAAEDYAAVRRDMASDLRQLAALLESKCSAWDASLTRSECRMLAASYVSLHRTWSEGMARLLLEAECAGTPENILQGIADMDRQLQERIRQLEQAMVRLGLTVIRPAQGDAFNGAQHVPAGTSAGAVGDSVIRRCVNPGVMAAGSPEAMIKAEVELK